MSVRSKYYSSSCGKILWYVGRIITMCALCWYLPAATKLWPRLYFYTCLSFCPQGGVSRQGESPQTGRTPPGRENPPGRETPPDQADPPAGRTPPGQGEPHRTRQTPPAGRKPPGQGEPPGPGRTPPDQADSRIRSTSGRYASYWNAFLFTVLSPFAQVADFAKLETIFSIVPMGV